MGNKTARSWVGMSSLKAIRRFLKKLFWVKRLYVFDFPLDEDQPEQLDASAENLIRIGTAEDWGILEPFLLKAYNNPKSNQRFRKWLDRPDDRFCYLGFLHGELVYNSWIVLSDYYDDTFDLLVPVAKGVGFGVAAYTKPGARSHMLHRSCVVFLMNHCRTRGLKRIQGWITSKDYKNASASFEKAGFKRFTLEQVNYVRMAGFRRLFLRTPPHSYRKSPSDP
ncbi:MAG: hypothetical protein KJ645_05760 [Planctomycetes bacterium]|nr:hypothetical protein [Planctomycetota bacterium]